MELDEEFITKTATELFLAKMIAIYAGVLTGKQVAAAHRCVVEKLCKDKKSWDLFACVVDGMHMVYSKARELGFERAMKEITCEEYLKYV